MRAELGRSGPTEGTMPRHTASIRLAVLSGLLAASLLLAGLAAAKPPAGTPAASRDDSTILVDFASSAAADGDVSAQGDSTAGHAGAGVSIVKLKHGESVDDGLSRYRGAPGVLYAEPNYIATAQVAPPSDPSFTAQWGLAK